MVERHLPGFPPDQLPGAAAAAKEKSAEMTSEALHPLDLGSRGREVLLPPSLLRGELAQALLRSG